MLVWLWAMVRRKPVHGLRLKHRALIFAGLGLTMGTLLDAFHVYNDTASYFRVAMIPYLRVAWYVPLEFTAAGLAVGLLRPELDEELRRKRSDLPAAQVLLGLGLLVVAWGGSGVLTKQGVPNYLIGVALLVIAVGAWGLFDRTREGVIAAFITGGMGVVVESSISWGGTYHYTHPDFWRVPLWLPILYFTVCIAGGNLGRFLKYSWDVAMHPRPAPPEAERPRKGA